jgi:peptidoglycan hydrolase-like protein with peptidoglycan-binding domain
VSATAEKALLIFAAVFALAGCGVQPAAQPGSGVPTTTAPVVRTDIVATGQLAGTLTYAGDYTVVNELTGVYTVLPSPGTMIARGQALYRVDNQPVVLMYGVPEWRALSVGATGPDVRQLELNLIALGVASPSNLVADGYFDSFDAAAVRRLQADLGEPQSGVVGFGDVVYESGPVRVTSVTAGLGEVAQPGTPLLVATSQVHIVSVQLGVDQQSLVKTGDSVTVLLPDGSTTAGTVSAVGRVATTPPPSPNGATPVATVDVTITLTDPSAGGTLDEAPVDVEVTDAEHRSVLAVPVMALLAQPGGTYAVDVVDGSHHRLVTVTLGLFDNRGLVEVQSSELSEGMRVVVPVT